MDNICAVALYIFELINASEIPLDASGDHENPQTCNPRVFRSLNYLLIEIHQSNLFRKGEAFRDRL